MVSRSLALALIALTTVSCGNPVGPQAPEAVGTPHPDTGLATGDGFLELHPLSGEDESRPTSVNSAGRVVGTSGDMPVVWDDSFPVALEIPSGAGARSHELWINDAGTIAGSLDIEGSLRAVRWDGGRLVELGTLPGHVDSRATG